MKPISKHLCVFLDKHINLSKTKLSKFSTSLLKTLFKTIILAESEYTPILPNWIGVNNDKFPKGYDFEYCDEEIKTEINKTKKSACILSFNIKNHSFQIAIVSPETKTQLEKKIPAYTKRIYIWLYLATTYAPTTCSQKLNIYLYLTSLKKYIPTSRDGFTQAHANTAFTTSCKRNTEIHIYREEEWFKVLIHESFHCFGLDFSSENQSYVNKEILSVFPIQSKVNLFEVYCETFAEIINDMIISQDITKRIENRHEYIKKMLSKTEDLLHKEREFSLIQCVKVLDFYGMRYSDLYERNDFAAQNRKKYRENNTNIFSYYILKAVFMFYYDEFLQWCFLHNNQSICFNPNKMPQFITFIKTHYKQQDFLSEIEKVHAFFKAFPKNVDEISMNTMRMSIYEL